MTREVLPNPVQSQGAYSADFNYDVVLVGAGIMSATLATLLHELDPDLRMLLVERLEGPALESSAAENNAGTGHAANCELNYTPINDDGTISTFKAVEINAAFERSLEFWGSLSELGRIDPGSFLRQAAHISAVWTYENIHFLRQRYLELSNLPAFSGMSWSEDHAELASWMPLVMEGRDSRQAVAATRIERGTDVDFGALTRAYLQSLQGSGALTVKYNTEVRDLNRMSRLNMSQGGWKVTLCGASGLSKVSTPFVFLGAGGGVLPLLQRSGIPEAADFAGFPVSGIWLVCNKPELVNRQKVKVYGKADVGSPPMSVPHLDNRWIDGSRSLLFGPFAGFSSKFLKQGSLMDLPGSVRITNLLPMLNVGISNRNLVRYLINQLLQSSEKRHNTLKQFMPNANQEDWRLSFAGQRVQIIKCKKGRGRLQFGTEVVAASDGSLAALLGASPGASTAVAIMLEVIERCFGNRLGSAKCKERLKGLFPSYGVDITKDIESLKIMRRRSNNLLGLIA